LNNFNLIASARAGLGAAYDMHTSVSKTSSDMKLMFYERKHQLSDSQSNRLCANSVVCSKNSAVLVLLATYFIN